MFKTSYSRPLLFTVVLSIQLVLHAAARLAVKKRKWDVSITPSPDHS